MSAGDLFEMLQVLQVMPRELIIFSDYPVWRHRGDHIYDHAILLKH